MEKINTKAQEDMQEALQKFLNKKESSKDYFTQMKALTAWLNEKVKQ